MADNFIANPGVGGDTFAADDIGGVKIPRSKIVIGADGANDGDVSSSNPLPVTGSVSVSGAVSVSNAGLTDLAAAINASSQLDVNIAASTAVPVTDNGGSLTVDGTVAATQSGTWTVTGTGGTFPVTDSGGSLTVDGTVAVSSISGQFAEDSAHSSGATGNLALVVRRDANTTLVDTDGDYAPLQVDASGSLKVAITAGAGSGGTSATDDAAFTAASGSGTPIMGFNTTDQVNAGDVGVLAMSLDRALHTVGNIAAAATDSGNPLKVGGVFNSTRPTYTTGQRGDAQITARGGWLCDFEDYVVNGSVSAVDAASSVAVGEDSQSIITGTPSTNSVFVATGSGNSSFAVLVTGTWVGTLQFERSLDSGSTYTPVAAFSAGTAFSQATITSNGAFHGNASSATNIRVRATAWTSGSATIRILLGQGTGTVTVGNPIRLIGSDFGSQATIKAASTAAASTDTALVTALNPASTNPVAVTPSTSGGWSAYTGSLSNTATAVKTSAGQVGGWYIYNPNATVAYVQFFNALTGSVTVGTTAPVFSIGIPATSGANLELTAGMAYSTAISIAATTARANSTAPGTALDVNILYK